MKLPVFKSGNQKMQPEILQWGGLNRNELIADNQFSSTTNASTKNFPLICPRPPRATEATLTGTGRAIASSGTYLAWVDGTSFKYNGVTKGTVLAGAKSIVDFNGQLLIFPDKKYYDYVDDEFGTMAGSVRMTEYGYDAAGDVDYTATNKVRNLNIVTVTASTAYTLVNDKGYTVANAYYYNSEMQFISTAAVNFASFTTPATAAYMNFSVTGTDLTVEITITNAVYPTTGAIPDIDFATTINNRVWGVKNDQIYATALGDSGDWTTFSTTSLATDAFNVDTGTSGDFTGIHTYKNTMCIFKKDIMWKLYGDIPSNFTYTRVTEMGCLDNNSLVEIDNVLYFLGRKGFYAYSGGVPELVSTDLNEEYSSCVAGGDNRRYYASAYNGTAYKLLVYDTMYRVWMQEDTLQCTGFAQLDGYLYALASDNKIYKFNSGTEKVTMELITKNFTDNLTEKKKTYQLNFTVDLAASSVFLVYKRTNEGPWISVKSYTSTSFSSFYVPIAINRADCFQIKMVMIGDGNLYKTERMVYIGGRV